MKLGSSSAFSIRLCAPALDGPITGGTRFNTCLLAALERAGADARWLPLEAAEHSELARAYLLVDSLYLEAVPRLRARVAPGQLWLLLHYLPSLVRAGRVVSADELELREREALAAADGCVVTSAFMHDQLAKLGLGTREVIVVEPGTDIAPSTREPDAGVRAVMLANLVEGKQVLPFLRALVGALREDDEVAIELIGSFEQEPAYARACRAYVDEHSLLSTRVRTPGALPHAQALERLSGASVLVSTSRMESYGMALAEARAAGVPIIACRGGHTAALVESESGGAMCDDPAAVAHELLACVRDRSRLARRRQRAQAGVRARSWDTAADALRSGLMHGRAPT